MELWSCFHDVYHTWSLMDRDFQPSGGLGALGVFGTMGVRPFPDFRVCVYLIGILDQHLQHRVQDSVKAVSDLRVL